MDQRKESPQVTSCLYHLEEWSIIWGGFSVEIKRTREEPGTQAPLDLRAFYFSTSHRRWFFGTFLTDRWWVHVPVSLLFFLGVGLGTTNSILGL